MQAYKNGVSFRQWCHSIQHLKLSQHQYIVHGNPSSRTAFIPLESFSTLTYEEELKRGFETPDFRLFSISSDTDRNLAYKCICTFDPF